MFKSEDGAKFSQAKQEAESNYIINADDYLELQVFTKNGEKLIDPEFALTTGTRVNEQNMRPKLKYLVQQNGFVKLPMVGEVKLQGLTILEAEQILQEKYALYYKDAFINLQYLNKRVIVLGSLGGHVVPLANENMRITEILALAEGVNNNSKVQNIRLLRGEEVFLIDLSTIDGYRQSNMIVRSGDVLYIEPVRRPFTEFMRENGPVISAISGIVSLAAVLISIN